jgi:hypothetical protein
MKRTHRLAVLAGATIVALLSFASVAFAADGEGLLGRADDKLITYFSFGVMAFFAAFVIIASAIQDRLESRKERVREEIERLRQP